MFIAAMTVVTSLALAPSPSPVAAAGTTDLLVGDSVMAGMSASSRSVLPPHVFDALVCRRLVSQSCSYQGVRPATALSVIRANAGRVNRAIVVAVGYNDSSVGGAVDAIVGEARRQGVPHVIWLTYRLAGGHAGTYANSNATLWAKAAQYPELRIADWASASRGRGDWVAGDGLHLTSRGASAMANLIKSALDSLVPSRCDLAANGSPGQPQRSVSSVGTASGLVMHDTPQRVLDTRFTPDGAVRAKHFIRVPIPSNVPADALGVVATITAVGPCTPGFVTAYRCGSSMPVTSTLNPNRIGATANLAIVPLAGDRTICLYTHATVDLIVDLLGHLATSGNRVAPVGPIRLVDTRPGLHDELATPDGALAPRSAMSIPVGEVDAVGPDAVAVALNVTVTQPLTRGYVTAYPGPCAPGSPTTSNLNFVAGETIAAATITRIGSDRSICVYNHSGSHVIVDLTGVVGPTGRRVRTAENVRLVDTRDGSGPSSAELRVPTGVTSAPPNHTGVITNTVAIGARRGYAAVRGCGSGTAPTTSTVNHLTRPIANVAVVDVAAGGFCIYRHHPAHLVVDAVAWLVP